MATCYRHPSRETGVSCSSCGRPICPDCMTPTPVGMRCPECASQRTKVRTARTLTAPTAVTATHALIALNVIVFLVEVASGVTLGGTDKGWVYVHGALFGPLLTGGSHEYWRLLTSAFLHAGLLHIAFNMLFLFFIGRVLEPAVGRASFLVIYFSSLLTGSFGVLLFQPDVPTLGASGALFGLLGALVVVAWDRGISIWQSGIGATLLINLVFTLSVPNVSIGGHLGGLVGGLICGWFIVRWGQRRGWMALAWGGCALVATLSVAAAIAVAGGHGLTPHGLSL